MLEGSQQQGGAKHHRETARFIAYPRSSRIPYTKRGTDSEIVEIVGREQDLMACGNGNLSRHFVWTPNIGFGKPCLTGARIDVATVVGALAAGESFGAVQEAYSLTRQQILVALRYAAHVAEHVPPAVKQASRRSDQMKVAFMREAGGG